MKTTEEPPTSIADTVEPPEMDLPGVVYCGASERGEATTVERDPAATEKKLGKSGCI